MSLGLFDRSHHSNIMASRGTSRRSVSPILPSNKGSPSPPRRSSVLVGFPRRYARLGTLAILSLCAISFFFGFERTEKIIRAWRKPPRYTRYHAYERNLPQHDLNLPYPEGRDAKFFWASNHVTSAYTLLFLVTCLLNCSMYRIGMGKRYARAACECPSCICD